ncbi:hypothetical protein FA10DRAFT_267466 [Acaromyces ingoldii]|uniref:Uncharacterized protein n=1 Tax=Acaromyces ingoldii TaxID=215250 RepID=A0A316YTI2_9BASI|nr:hypothetical protein FA10DRAFT_267466 [Acaromyces ingoldii]PWN91055.1 hypothetical protein FA10DRAFT_267466 [Acaromyces ingoldii]
MSSHQTKPPHYEPRNVEIDGLAEQADDDALRPHGRPSHAGVEGPSFKEWVFIVSACVIGGYWLASFLYKPAKATLDIT